MNKRLDQLLVERGLAPTRSKAQGYVLAGQVRVDGEVHTKAGSRLPESAEISIDLPDHPWVSRGALKLVAALDAFAFEPKGLELIDVGASTGGFTQVLLERGAERVIALDVGKNQLDWKIRSDPRVHVMEGYNARYLQADDLPFAPKGATFDLSFISLGLVVPAVLATLEPPAWLVCLIKPQFEAGRDQVGRGGIVRDERVRETTILRVIESLESLGLELVGRCESPIRGQKGNLEELTGWRWRG